VYIKQHKVATNLDLDYFALNTDKLSVGMNRHMRSYPYSASMVIVRVAIAAPED
jgi:hypothetical protein